MRKKTPETLERLAERNTKAYAAMGKHKFTTTAWKKYRAASDVFWDTEEELQKRLKKRGKSI